MRSSGPRTLSGARVCRVRPDVPALDRTFDYLVPEAMGDAVTVGTIVRVPLAGRRVRGWVVADDVEPEAATDKLLPLAKVVGAGPPAEVLALGEWAAWRWAGPVAHLLRAASPPNAVRAAAGRQADSPALRAVSFRAEVLAWPPAGDRRDLVADRIAADGSTLVVVPEAARLGALRKRLERDGHRMLELHGSESDAERTRAWAAARDGRCVVVGGRTAVWAPVPDLAAVVVLDEGDEALQEERTPTWNGRDVAVERARRQGATLTLVAAAPTLEAQAVGGSPVRPERSIERDGWPIVEVVDPRNDAPGTGLLTEPLATALHHVIDRGERAVCVLNRRGRARLLACVACTELARCERCGAFVSETESGGLQCASCGLERPMVCLHCHATRMKALRPGVARVRDDLAALLPRVEVVEVDASTDMPAAGQVFVGTEAVLHRLPPGPRLGLVAFLDFDQELLAPRYRAGRAGARAAGARGAPARTTDRRWPPARADPAAGPRSRGGGPPSRPDRRRRRRAAAARGARLPAVRCPGRGARAWISRSRRCSTGSGTSPRSTCSGPPARPPGWRRSYAHRHVDVLCDALAAAAPAARSLGRLRIAVDPLRV